MIVVALILGIFLLYIYLIYTKPFPLDDVPGPSGSWIWGNTLQIKYKTLHKTLADWSYEFGSVFKIKFFRTPVLIVSDLRSVNFALVKKSADFSGRPARFREGIMSEDQSGIALTDSHTDFRGRRQAIYMYLKDSEVEIKRIEDLSHLTLDSFIQKLTEERGEAFDVRDMILEHVIELIMLVVIGEKLVDSEMKALKNLLIENAVAKEKTRSGEFLEKFPIFKHLGHKSFVQLQKMSNLKEELVDSWMKKDSTRGFIHHIQELSYDDLYKYRMDSKKQQRNVAWDFVSEGIYTMTATLATLVNVLSYKPEIQEKLQKEIEETVKDGKVPSLEHRSYMPYHQAVLLETCRFASVMPLGKPHKAIKPTVLGKHVVPKGTEIWTNLWAMHHNDKLWDEPYEFRPERFLDDDECLVGVDHPARRNLMPFGGGYRACSGETLAMTRMFLMLARTMQRFRVLPESTEDRQASMDPREMELCGDVLMPPAFRIRVKHNNNNMEE